jgi:outer membrane protein assembly factor BamD (BamD/ComL family)
MKYLKSYSLLIVSIACFALASCKTPPEVLPETLTAQELIQRGQDAYDKGKNADALRYFSTVIDRYGTDTSLYIEARYEIAHLFMKEKKYEAAIPILEEIRDLYPKAEPGTLPASYEKLAIIELNKVPGPILKKFDAARTSQSISNSATQ